MSIVVYRDGIMAADSGLFQGQLIISRNARKVFFWNKLHSYRHPSIVLCGIVGTYNLSQNLMNAIRTEDEIEINRLTRIEDEWEECPRAITVDSYNPGEITVYDWGDKYTIEEEFIAIGSGKEYAYGALHNEATAVEAVLATARSYTGVALNEAGIPTQVRF